MTLIKTFKTSTPTLRNNIINGGLDFWNWVFTNPIANATFFADRFRFIRSGTATQNITQDTSNFPTFAQSGFQSQNSLSINPQTTQASPGATDRYGFVYPMEGQDYETLHGQPVRLQFWVYCSVAGVYGVSFQNANVDRAYAQTYTITTPNTWQKINIDLTMDTTGTWAFDTSLGLRVQWWLAAGSSQVITPGSWQSVGSDNFAPSGMTNTFNASGANVFKIAQIALYQLSATASDDFNFSRAGSNIAAENDMVRRYFHSVGGGIGDSVDNGYATTTTTTRFFVPFTTKMRTAPSRTFVLTGALIDDGNGSTFTVTSLADISPAAATDRYVFIQAGVASGLTTGRGYTLRGNTGGFAVFLSAEL